MADTADDDYAIDQKAAEAPLLPRSTTRGRSSTADRYKPLALRKCHSVPRLSLHVLVVLGRFRYATTPGVRALCMNCIGALASRYLFWRLFEMRFRAGW